VLDSNIHINPNDLSYQRIFDTFDTNTLDCTEDEKFTDSQGVQDYLCNHALADQEQNLSVTYLVSYQSKVVAYCSVTPSLLPFEKAKEQKPDTRAEIKNYPALMITNLGTDKESRGKGIASGMLEHCIGLAVHLSELVGCRYVMLYSTKAVGFYSEKNKTKYRFYEAFEKKDGNKLMLFRIFSKISRHLSEKIPIGDSVSAKVTKAEDVEKRKNNPRLCNSCDKETEIVYTKDNIRLCKKCVVSFRDN
jgi:GNAT superfamily N-acetyltransferase